MDKIVQLIDGWPQWIQILSGIVGTILAVAGLLWSILKPLHRKIFRRHAPSEKVGSDEVVRRRQAYEQLRGASSIYNRMMHELDFFGDDERWLTPQLEQKLEDAKRVDGQIAPAKDTIVLEPGGHEVINLYNRLCGDLQGVSAGKRIMYAEGTSERYLTGNTIMRKRFDKTYQRFETTVRNRVRELEG